MEAGKPGEVRGYLIAKGKVVELLGNVEVEERGSEGEILVLEGNNGKCWGCCGGNWRLRLKGTWSGLDNLMGKPSKNFWSIFTVK
jgi:hypothetical protein